LSIRPRRKRSGSPLRCPTISSWYSNFSLDEARLRAACAGGDAGLRHRSVPPVDSWGRTAAEAQAAS
jgi:hypothetical protein